MGLHQLETNCASNFRFEKACTLVALNLSPQTSVLSPQSSNLSPQSSVLKPQSSNLSPQTSVLKPQSSNLSPQSSFY
ncbi:hypothetical protein NDA03_14075 [Trichocoleus sp. Lan]|uniref:hypothetical protein n=1 Tax=Trichocoleus sp. Lan TaxID=2933927 RepID=UPI0032980865